MGTLSKAEISRLSREELEQQLQQAISAKEEAEQEADGLRDEIDELGRAKETSDARAKNFREKVRELQEELEEAKAVMESAGGSDDEESVPVLRFEASRLRTELDEVREEVKAAKARSAEAEEELEDLETRFAALQEELKAAQSSGGGGGGGGNEEEVEALRDELERLGIEAAGLTREMDVQRQEHMQEVAELRERLRLASEGAKENSDPEDEFSDGGELPLPDDEEEAGDRVSKSTGGGGADELSVSDGEEEEGKGERQQGSSAGTGDNTPRFTKEELANQLQQMFDDDSDGDVPKRSAQKPPPAAGAAAKKPAVAPAAVPAADRKPKVSPARRAAPAPKATPPSATRRPPAPTKTPPAPRPPPPARSSPEKGSAAAAPVPRREASPQKKGPAVRPSSAPTNRSISPSIARSTEKWIERRQMLVRRVDETREHATWQDSEFDRRVEEAKRRLSSPRGAPVPNLAKLHPWESARVTMPAPAPGDVPHPTQPLQKARDEKRHIAPQSPRISDPTQRRIDPSWRAEGKPASATITTGSGGLMSTAEREAKAAVLNIFAKLQVEESGARVPWHPETLDAPPQRSGRVHTYEPSPWNKVGPPQRSQRSSLGGPTRVEGAAGAPSSHFVAHQQKAGHEAHHRDKPPRNMIVYSDDGTGGKRVALQNQNNSFHVGSGVSQTQRVHEEGPRPHKRYYDQQRSIQPKPYGVDDARPNTQGEGLLSTVGLS